MSDNFIQNLSDFSSHDFAIDFKISMMVEVSNIFNIEMV